MSTVAESSTVELQGLLYETLASDSQIMDLANDIYDHVPENPFGDKTAYISFGASDTSEDDSECISGVLTTIQIDIWSRQRGRVECRRLTDMVRRKLHRAQLSFGQHALAELWVEISRVIPDPGGDQHGVVQVTATIEER